MKTTARQPEPQVTFSALLGAGLASLGMTIVRNPVAVGGATAFLVSFAFVSANALWYQPHSHQNALISTRERAIADERQPAVTPAPIPTPAPAPAEREAVEPVVEIEPARPSNDTTGAIPPERPVAEQQGGDATIRDVQKVLADLGLYTGTVDGLQGPQTRAAINKYRRIVGLEASESVDQALLRQLGLAEETTTEAAASAATVPAPTPRPSLERAAPAPATPVQTASLDATAERVGAPAEADPTIMRIQAGLKAFGNDDIEIDGVLGASTQAAIREFQSLFGLQETGKPDEAFLAKMREVGLTN